MKKIFIAALMTVAISASAFANVTEVSSRILSRFSSDFEGASEVEWKTTNDYSKATFVLAGVKVEAFYDATGELFATGKSLEVSSLSKKTMDVIAKKYDGYKIKEAVTVTDAENVTRKYVALENEKSKVVLEIVSEREVSLFSKTKK